MNIKEFEKLIIQSLYEDGDFYEFINENAVDFEENLREQKNTKYENYDNLETGTLEYFEEISQIGFLKEEELNKKLENVEENIEEIVTKNLRLVLKIGMLFLKEGIDYMDLVQEGTVELINCVKNFEQSRYLEFEKYAKINIARKMIIYINERLEENKSEFLRYFENTREEYSDKEDIVEELTKKIKIIKSINFSNLYNTLNDLEFKIVEKYYGLNEEKSYSMFEIEKMFNLEKGNAEGIFQNAINKLSKFGGEFFKI